MSYVEKHLIPGESIQYQTKLHWIVMLGHVAIAAVFELLAITFLAAAFSKQAGAKSMPSRSAEYLGALICFLVGAALFCIGLLKRNVTEMAVTNKRVIVKTGLAERRTTEILAFDSGEEDFGTPYDRNPPLQNRKRRRRRARHGKDPRLRNGNRARDRWHSRSVPENPESFEIQRTSPKPNCR